MKKVLALSALAIVGVMLTSCSNQDKIIKKDIYTSDGATEVTKAGYCDLLFKKDSEIPYISLNDSATLLSNIYSSTLKKDEKCNVELKRDGNNFVLSKDDKARCTVNVESQTLTYDDYDKFTSLVSNNQNPLSLVTLNDSKALKAVSSQYTPGNTVTIDLKPYAKLDAYLSNNMCYLPLSVINSVLLNTVCDINLAYNGNDLFLIGGSSLTIELLGEVGLTSLGEKFHADAHKEAISD